MTKKSKKKVTSKKQSKKATDLAPSSKKKRVNGCKKGKAFERYLANEIQHIFPQAERMLEAQASAVIGVDLQNTGDLKFQCKRNAGYCSISKIGEIKMQDEKDIPVLVTKGNGMAPMAVLPLEKFVTLLEVVYGLSEQWAPPEEVIKKNLDFMTEKEDNTSIIGKADRLLAKVKDQQNMTYKEQEDIYDASVAELDLPEMEVVPPSCDVEKAQNLIEEEKCNMMSTFI